MKTVLFYGIDRITKTLNNNVKKSDYRKDKAFFTLFRELDEKT